MIKWLMSGCLLLVPCIVISQTTDKVSDGYGFYGLRLSYGTIFAHSKSVQNTAGARPYGIELEWGKRHLDSTAWNTCLCYPATGILVGYTNFDNPVLGHGFYAAYFIEHYFLPYTRITPTLRGAAGLALANRPYDPDRNPTNQSYSTLWNAYLLLQGGIQARIGSSSLMGLRAEYSHISNGGLKEPNKGVNWPSVSIAYAYTPGYTKPERLEKQRNLTFKASRWIWRGEVFGSVNTRYIEEQQRYLTYGAALTSAYKLSNLHTLSAGMEWHYAQDHRKRIEVNGLDVTAHRAGLLLGHDFLFGHFVFSQQVGVYVLDRFKQHDPIYHRWGLSYVHKSGISIGGSLKAHRHVAEFVDVRLGYHLK